MQDYLDHDSKRRQVYDTALCVYIVREMSLYYAPFSFERTDPCSTACITDLIHTYISSSPLCRLSYLPGELVCGVPRSDVLDYQTCLSS